MTNTPLRQLVNQSWDLQNLAKSYHAFVQRFSEFGNSPVARKLTPTESFVVRTLLTHRFRRVTLLDPQIPAELLPNEWPGHVAYELCHRMYQVIYRDAEDFLSQTVSASGGILPDLSLWFYQRLEALREPRIRF